MPNHRDDLSAGGIELRVVVPRSALPAPAPEFFSQLNCELLGLQKRQFLELLRRPGAPAVTKVGKARLVRRTEMLSFLERMRVEDGHERTVATDDLDDADQVLLEMGLVPCS